MSMVARANEAVRNPEVQAMVRELAKYGLGVFLPHIHTPQGFAPLPSDTVQVEADLKVSFVKNDNPMLVGASPVAWVWDAAGARVAAACYCGGAQHDPHWDRPPR
jgi:hypothetical protein